MSARHRTPTPAAKIIDASRVHFPVALKVSEEMLTDLNHTVTSCPRITDPKILKAIAEIDEIVASTFPIHIAAIPFSSTEVFRNKRTGNALALLTRIKKAPQ